MWKEMIFFTELDKLRFLHGFLRIIWFYHLPGKYPEADPQDDWGDGNQSMSGCPLLTTVSCQDPCPYKVLQAVFSNPIPTRSHRLTKSQTGRSPEHHKSNERHREKQEKHINEISSLGVPKWNQAPWKPWSYHFIREYFSIPRWGSWPHFWFYFRRSGIRMTRQMMKTWIWMFGIFCMLEY